MQPQGVVEDTTGATKRQFGSSPSQDSAHQEHTLSEHTSNISSETKEPTSFADFGKELWSYLTGRGAAINYQFVDMLVEVPKSTGADSERATWRLHGTLRITTSENASTE